MQRGRKKRTISALILAVLLSASQAQAIDIYGFGSYWDKEEIDGTWGAGLGLSLPFIIDMLRLDGRVYFFEESRLGPDGNLTLMPFDLGLQVHILPDAAVDPYVLGGVSYIYADGDKVSATSSMGGYLGAGLDINLGIPLLSLFAEGLYRFSEIDTDTEKSFDVSGFTGNVGLKISF